jgi:signal transduction histidine kinase
MPPTADPLAGPVRVARADGLITISVHGRLDAHAGVELLAALQAELDGRPPRVDVDLVAVDRWTREGANSLRRARRLVHGLPAELHYRTAAGAGHEALLAAFDDTADDTIDDDSVD